MSSLVSANSFRRVGVREGITYVRTQHNGRLLCRRQCNHLEIPSHVAQTIRHITDDLTREALITIRISETERDTISRVRNDGPVSPIPAIWTAVQSICSSRCSSRWILIGKNIVRRPIDHETAVLDAICVPSGYAAEMRMLAILFLSAFPHFILRPLTLLFEIGVQQRNQDSPVHNK